MMRHLLLALTVGLGPSLLRAGEPSEPLKVLFLGDNGHHRPADRAAQLTPVMAGRGIALTYTDQLADLNPPHLARYATLLIYANIDTIEPSQEKALLDYVAGGGGLVAIHCASSCFQNSPAYIALVGAQFLGHGTGEFDTQVVDPDHPITKALEPFRTWDETYVHTKHNEADRHVLQVRGEEPWTWVRTPGQGRVFYTAYGHDHRTWQDPGFHDLIERGIRWAAGHGEVFDSRPRVPAGLKPLAYTPAEVPLYLPDANRKKQQVDNLRRMQEPLSPAESMRHMTVPRGFEVRLFAAEPDIAKPIGMAWDHRGRLWIAETVDYPNDLQRPGEGHDRIKICEDTDGDGRADRFTVFAEKLSIPTSLAFAQGGVVVAQAPQMLFLKDTNGDDKADVRRVLFSGWETRDTHAGPSNLRWGFDNWLWGMVGYSGFEGSVGGEDLEFSQGFFRVKPDGTKLEFLRSTNNNSWGFGFSEEGLVFGSTANGNPSVYLPIPNRSYEAVRGWSARVLGPTAASPRFFPVTDQVRQVDNFGAFTAAAGHALYTARAYPRPYWNSTAFVSDPTGHLTATFTLQRKGSDFTTYNGWNLLASDDEWTSPVAAEVGPDGQVWVIDWYSFIVQHNPTPQGFKTGKGAAYVTPLRDKTHGRIYRVVATGSKPVTPLALDPDDPAQLVATLKNDNLLWRMHAQRLLVERGQQDVVPKLIRLVQDRSVDAIGLNAAAIHALWTLHGLRVLDGQHPAATAAALTALKHPSAGVRRNALQVVPRDESTAAQIVAAGSLSDEDAHVRLAALLALAEMPRAQAAADAIAAALVSGTLEEDRWLPDAATSAAAAHDREFLRALAARRLDRPVGETALAVVDRVAEHYARGGPADSVGGLLIALPGAGRDVTAGILAGLARGWPEDRPAELDVATEEAMVRLLPRLSPAAKGQLVGLAVRWGSKALEKYTAEIAAAFLATAQDETKPDSARVAAARQLIEFRKSDAEPVQTLLGLITPRTAPALATGLVEVIGRSEAPGVGEMLVAGLPMMTPAVRPDALRVLLGRADWTEALLDGVDQGQIPLSQLSLDQKQALAAHPDGAIARRAQRLLARSGGGLPDADRQKVIDELAPLILRAGDAAHGQEVFTQQCVKCHTLNGEGGKVGPDLTGMAAHPKDELLIHILDPSRSVEGNFVQYSVATTDGRILSGLLASETKTTIELIDAEGQTHPVLREEIEELAASKKSVMPEGFEKQVSPRDLADLLEFLTTPHGPYQPLDLRRAATAVSTRGMFYDADSRVERLIFPDWSPKAFEGVPFQLVDPQGDRVPNAILLYGPQGTIPPKMPRSVSLPCHVPAKAIHFLSGVSGWGARGDREAPTVSLVVRLHYAGGTTEDHRLLDGVHFADYNGLIDVPGSKRAFQLRGRQVRYLAVQPERAETIERIELIKGPDATAPVVMAVTVEVNP